MTTEKKPAAKPGTGKGKTPMDKIVTALEATNKPYLLIRLKTSSILIKDLKPGNIMVKTNMVGESVVITLSQILSDIQMQRQGVKIPPGEPKK